jgi:ribulose-phosphate 3-epimerase
MQNDFIKLGPSSLAADFARLGEQVAEAERAGADRIHVDVMDGHFVPNIAIGAPIVQSLRRITRLPMETHLMISDPDFFLDEFAEASSTSFLVHGEGNNNLHRTVQRIKTLGKRAGVAINPATPVSVLQEILPDLGHDCEPGIRASTLFALNFAQNSAGCANDRAGQARQRIRSRRGN